LQFIILNISTQITDDQKRHTIRIQFNYHPNPIHTYPGLSRRSHSLSPHKAHYNDLEQPWPKKSVSTVCYLNWLSLTCEKDGRSRAKPNPLNKFCVYRRGMNHTHEHVLPWMCDTQPSNLWKGQECASYYFLVLALRAWEGWVEATPDRTHICDIIMVVINIFFVFDAHVWTHAEQKRDQKKEISQRRRDSGYKGRSQHISEHPTHSLTLWWCRQTMRENESMYMAYVHIGGRAATPRKLARAWRSNGGGRRTLPSLFSEVLFNCLSLVYAKFIFISANEWDGRIVGCGLGNMKSHYRHPFSFSLVLSLSHRPPINVAREYAWKSRNAGERGRHVIHGNN
jgi:hypothetical protein